MAIAATGGVIEPAVNVTSATAEAGGDGQADPGQPTAQPPAAAPPSVAAQPAPTSAVTVDPADPWNLDLKAAAARQPSPVELFGMLSATTPPPDAAVLGKWFAAVAGKPSKFSDQRRGNWPCGTVDGLVRLRAPLAEGTALRMAASSYATLRILAWSGTTGVAIDAYGPSGPWAAYVTTRSGSDPSPTGFVLAARDEGRMDRTISQPVAANRPSPGIELRYADGLLTLARGDVRIVEAPLAVPPTDVYLEGPATFLELAMTRALPLPAIGLPPGEGGQQGRGESLPLARQSWLHSGTGAPPHSLPGDGGVEIVAEKNPSPVWSSFMLPAGGLREIVFRLDAASAGTGLCLGDPEGRPQHVLQFVANRHVDNACLQIDRRNPGDNAVETADHPTARPLALVRGPMGSDGTGSIWIKVSQCGGEIRCSTSLDGSRWTQAIDPLVNQAPFASVGIHAAAHPSRRLIRLRDVVVQRFATLESLVPVPLADAAVELPIAPIAAWIAAADASRPPAAARDAWRRACAIRQLAGTCSKDLAVELLALLWRDSLAMSLPIEGRLRLFDEIARLAPVWNDPAAAARCGRMVEELGLRLADAGHPRCGSLLAHVEQTCPLLCGQPLRVFSEPLARQETLELLSEGRWQELREWLTRLAFFGFADKPSNDLFFSWVAAVADGRPLPEGAGRTGPLAGLRPEWRHPLLVEPSREGVQLVADLDAALRDDSPIDACGLFVAAADGLPGLLPDPSAPDLLRSLAATAAAVMRDHPQVQETMRTEWGPRGMLRVRQAIETSDAAALEAATVQFIGTEAAAEAHAWLGDRALAAGSILQARGHYSRGGRSASAATEERIRAGSALADEILARETPVLAGLPTATERLPVARGYEAVSRASLEGDLGANPAGLPAEYARGGPGWAANSIDWVARQAVLVSLPDRLLVANRFQLASHDPQTGQAQWRAGVGGDAAGTHEWPGQPMKPVATTTHAYVRRLKKTGPALAAIRLTDGTIQWESKPRSDHWLVSDPVHIDGLLHVCTATKAEGPVKGEVIYLLSLATLDPATGAVLQERPLVSLRDQWWPQRDCQLTVVDDSFVVICGGSVVCCEPSGAVRWVRRNLWVPSSIDSFWMFQAQSPPVVADGRLLVVQPGVPDVMAIDAADGRMLWKCSMPGPRRVLGCTGDTVVVERSRGIDALAIDDGRRRWRFDSADLLDACLVSAGACLVGGAPAAAGGVLVAVREPAEDSGPQQPVFVPTLVWLDAGTGSPQRREGLPALRDQQPFFGPIVQQGERLWALSGRGMAEAKRDIVELVPR